PSFEILKSDLTEAQINSYLTTSKTLDDIEGIYESSSYKLGVKRIKENTFYATVISSTNENWKPGEVKLIINKNEGLYKGTFFDGNKEEKTEHKVSLVNNILDFDIVLYDKVFPQPKTRQDIKEYEIMKDEQAPKLFFPKNDLAVFAFPNFYGDSFEQLEYLLKKYEAKLKSTPYWIIDLSNNDGGDYLVGMQLMKYIYTKPVIDYNSEMRMSESNYNMWYNNYVKATYERSDANTKKQFEEIFSKMKANFGKMYNRSGKLTDTVTLDYKLEIPRKIGLIISKNTVSSGELFTLLARQSDKVQVFGENSGGMMDYGNIVTYRTDCSSIRVRLPMNRQLWLNTGYSVDKEGIKPAHYLGAGNWIEKTYQHLIK
ncbi:MAG: S41 family peptidase, partial [Bacteroidia bacterium]